MTAHALVDDRQKSLDAGMDDHLNKPVDPELLKRALLHWMPEDRGQGAEDREQDSSDPHSQSGALLPGQPPGLPSALPPFDIPKALVRCNNKSDLLRRLLLAFGEEYAGAMARLRGLIAESDLGDARILAHSMKGVAATLEARALSEAAKAVEMALREERIEGLEELLRPMETELDIALTAVQSLARPSDEPAPEPAGPDPDTPLP